MPKGRVLSHAMQAATLPASPPCRPENADIHHPVSGPPSLKTKRGIPFCPSPLPHPRGDSSLWPSGVCSSGFRPGEHPSTMRRGLRVPTAHLTPLDLSFLTCKMETMRTRLYQSVFSSETEAKGCTYRDVTRNWLTQVWRLTSPKTHGWQARHPESRRCKF